MSHDDRKQIGTDLTLKYFCGTDNGGTFYIYGITVGWKSAVFPECSVYACAKSLTKKYHNHKNTRGTLEEHHCLDIRHLCLQVLKLHSLHSWICSTAIID